MDVAAAPAAPAAPAEPIGTVAAVIDALGGVEDAATIMEEAAGTVMQWRQRGSFPARLYRKHTAILTWLGLAADPALWKQEALPEVADGLREALRGAA